MRVCMIGWDFPPHITGGLGVAVSDLAHAVEQLGVEVTVLLPRTQEIDGSVPVVFADAFSSYHREKIHQETGGFYDGQYNCYGQSLSGSSGAQISFLDVTNKSAFAQAAVEYLQKNHFDVVHIHDLLTYSVGIAIKQATSIPVVVHVHATSYDQAAGDNVDPYKYHLEQRALSLADSIIAVSDKVKQTLVEKHNIPAEKIDVIYNGIKPSFLTPKSQPPVFITRARAQKQNIVLFAGRITIQKGVDYFITAALRVLEYRPNTLFVIVGDGDQMPQMLEQISHSGHSKRFVITGWLSQKQVTTLYQVADLFVMPSVSEPFGLVPLEALQHQTPVIVSKQSGVAEVLTHALVVDFWDTDRMSAHMISVLRYHSLAHELHTNGFRQSLTLDWQQAADKCTSLYRRLTERLITITT